MRRHLPVAAGLTVMVLAGIGAPAASALEVCVAPATGCATSQPTITAALAAAGAEAGADTIRLGAATYSENNLKRTTADPLSIVGAGREATVIRRATTAVSDIVFEALTSARLDLSRLTVRITGTGPAGVGSLEGLRSFAAGGTIDDVAIEDLATAGSNSNAARLGSGVAVTNSSIALTSATNSVCLGVLSEGDPITVTDSTIICPTGVSVGQGAMQIQRSTIRVNGGYAVNVGGSATMVIDDSVLWATAPGVNGILQTTSTNVPSTTMVRQSTIVGVGGGTGAECFSHAGTSSGSLTLVDSIVTGFATTLKRDVTPGHSCTLSANHIAKPAGGTSNTAGVGGGTFNPPTNETNAAPGFTNQPAGDFRLLSTSALIDRDPTPLAWGEPALDRLGSQRIIGAGRDLGAFERPQAADATLAAPTGITQTTATVPGSATTGGTPGTAKLVYGTTTGYGSETAPVALTNATAGQPFGAALTGLAAGTTYHAALVVTTAYGTTTSPDLTFATAATPVVTPPPPPINVDPPFNPPAARTCKVPRLKGLTAAGAAKVLKKAGCRAGKVTKPRRFRRGAKLRVSTQSRRAGTRVPLGTKVGVTLKVKATPKRTP